MVTLKTWKYPFALLLGSVGLALLLSSGAAAAEPYFPAQPRHLLSRYAPADGSQPVPTDYWTVVPQADESGRHLAFVPGLNAAASPLCRVTLSAANAEIVFAGPAAVPEAFEHLMLLPDFPAPCDILPVAAAGDDRQYTHKKSAGGAVFVRQYRVQRQPVTLAEARASGWLAEGLTVTAPLFMVSVVDAENRVVARQLWSQGGDWWLYEENGVRRSWRVAQP